MRRQASFVAEIGVANRTEIGCPAGRRATDIVAGMTCYTIKPREHITDLKSRITRLGQSRAILERGPDGFNLLTTQAEFGGGLGRFVRQAAFGWIKFQQGRNL